MPPQEYGSICSRVQNRDGQQGEFDDTGVTDPLINASAGGELVDRGDDDEARRRRESFILNFAKSKGPPQIVLVIMLLALGFGSTIGVVSYFSLRRLLFGLLSALRFRQGGAFVSYPS